MTWLRANLTVPLAVLLVGFGFSLVANMASTWDSGPIRVLGGALASLALPASIHLWPRVPTHGAWTATWRGAERQVPARRIVRAAVMTLIATLAAVTTFHHVSQLLVQNGETPFLAMAYPIVSELVVVMAALAHRADTAAATPKLSAGARDDRDRAPAEPPPSTTPASSPVRAVGSSTSARARDWVRAEIAAGREPTGADVDTALGLEGKARCGARAVRQVLEQRERVS